jgi:hypothetical protein
MLVSEETKSIAGIFQGLRALESITPVCLKWTVESELLLLLVPLRLVTF